MKKKKKSHKKSTMSIHFTTAATVLLLAVIVSYKNSTKGNLSSQSNYSEDSLLSESQIDGGNDQSQNGQENITSEQNSFDNSSYETSCNDIETDVNDYNTLQQSQQQVIDSYTYVINISTGYFHLPNGCKYINKYSKPEDCVNTNGPYEDLLLQGYLPCRHCFN